MPEKLPHISSCPFSFRNDEWVSVFFKANYYSFLNFARKYIQDSVVVEDIFQDTIIKLIVTGKEFRQENEAKLYIYRTIRNKSLNYLRDERGKASRVSMRDKADPDDATFINYILEEELFNRLFEEIDRLPEQTRNVFLLALEGKRNQEIADRLDIGIETVKTHKKIGKELLKNRLSDIMPLFLLIWLYGL